MGGNGLAHEGHTRKVFSGLRFAVQGASPTPKTPGRGKLPGFGQGLESGVILRSFDLLGELFRLLRGMFGLDLRQR